MYNFNNVNYNIVENVNNFYLEYLLHKVNID